jgi:hypothetical protein
MGEDVGCSHDCLVQFRDRAHFPTEAIRMIRAVRPDVIFYLIPNYLDSVERLGNLMTSPSNIATNSIPVI